MSRIDELDKVIADTGRDAFGIRSEFPKDSVHTDVTNQLLWGILRALGIIGKILAERK